MIPVAALRDYEIPGSRYSGNFGAAGIFLRFGAKKSPSEISELLKKMKKVKKII